MGPVDDTDFVTAFRFTCFMFSFKGFWKNSSIIGDSDFYQSTLSMYLKPAVGSNPQWLLCWRASLHGWGARTWHTRCDGKPDTVTIIKVGQNIFGGYADIPFSKRNFLIQSFYQLSYRQ